MMWIGRLWIGGCLAVVLGATACGDDGAQQTGCVQGETMPCTCATGEQGSLVCIPDGTFYRVCIQCGLPGAGQPGLSQASGQPPAGAQQSWGGAAGTVGTMQPPLLESGIVAAPTYEALRVQCVERINMLRLTIGLAPLSRATPELEACADAGAQLDATTGLPYGSLGQCNGLPAQNTCGVLPQAAVASGAGVADPSEALAGCLDRMWLEGAPPVPVDSCVADGTGCYVEHGRYINMSSPNHRVVACGLYQSESGQLWVNQNFGY